MLFTVQQVADQLKASASFVYQLVESGKLRHHRIGNGRGTIRVSDQDLQDYLSGCRSTDRAKPKPARQRVQRKHVRLK